MTEEIESSIFVSDHSPVPTTGGLFAPSPAVFYTYRWGRRELDRGHIAQQITVSPAIIWEEPTWKEGGLTFYATMSAAKVACDAGGYLVICVRLGDDLSSPLLRVVRADYAGYLDALTFTSQLTGIPFAALAEGGDTAEEHVSITWRVRQLKRMRRRGKGNSPEALVLEAEIGEDFRQRHYRNIA